MGLVLGLNDFLGILDLVKVASPLACRSVLGVTFCSPTINCVCLATSSFTNCWIFFLKNCKSLEFCKNSDELELLSLLFPIVFDSKFLNNWSILLWVLFSKFDNSFCILNKLSRWFSCKWSKSFWMFCKFSTSFSWMVKVSFWSSWISLVVFLVKEISLESMGGGSVLTRK